MKRKKLELYGDFLLLIKYYKENQNRINREAVIWYLDKLTNDKFDLYQSKRNVKNKVKVLSLFK